MHLRKESDAYDVFHEHNGEMLGEKTWVEAALEEFAAQRKIEELFGAEANGLIHASATEWT
jgi:hypothetical protein